MPLQTDINTNEFSLELWDSPVRKQWNLYDSGIKKSPKHKSANVFLSILSQYYGNIFQNCFVDDIMKMQYCKHNVRCLRNPLYINRITVEFLNSGKITENMFIPQSLFYQTSQFSRNIISAYLEWRNVNCLTCQNSNTSCHVRDTCFYKVSKITLVVLMQSDTCINRPCNSISLVMW